MDWSNGSARQGDIRLQQDMENRRSLLVIAPELNGRWVLNLEYVADMAEVPPSHLTFSHILCHIQRQPNSHIYSRWEGYIYCLAETSNEPLEIRNSELCAKHPNVNCIYLSSNLPRTLEQYPRIPVHSTYSYVTPLIGSEPNHLIKAILATMLCFWPFGIMAVLQSARVNSRLRSGDQYGAHEASAKAKSWCRRAFGAAVAIYSCVIVFAVLFGE